MTLRRAACRCLPGLFCLLFLGSGWAAERVRLFVLGSDRNSSVQIARDIAKHVALPAGIEFDLRYSNGSPDTLLRLREGSGTQQWAMVQADVAPAYLDAVAEGSAEAGALFGPLRVMAPLYQEDLYFFVRADSPLNYVHDIKNARINLGEARSGTAMTAATLYRRLFGISVPENQASFRSQREALAKLTEQAVDVVALVAARPAKLLADMKPEARGFVKLLKFDPSHATSKEVTAIYSPTTILATSYPNLLTEDLPALSVGIYLVSHGRGDALQARFAQSWCQNLDRLRTDSHPALRSLPDLPPALPKDWSYSRPFERALLACRDDKPAPVETCTPDERALGLCG